MSETNKNDTLREFTYFTVNGWGFEESSLNFNSIIYHYPSTQSLKNALVAKDKPIIVPLHFNYDYSKNKYHRDDTGKYFYDYYLLNE